MSSKKEINKPPDGGYGWVVLIASFVSYNLNLLLQRLLFKTYFELSL
jgi:hypothetical protein